MEISRILRSPVSESSAELTERALPRRLLVVTSVPTRFEPFAMEADFVSNEREAIAAMLTRQHDYRAVIAAVAAADGREDGYRMARMLRTQLQVRCPIFLFSTSPTPSSRAYALQCGATKLLTDDHELVNDLLLLIGEAVAGG